MRTYLMVHSPDLGIHDGIKEWADQSALVVNWRYDLPNCFYLVSSASASELSSDLERFENAPGRKFVEAVRNGGYDRHVRPSRYLIAEIAENREGRLPKDTWSFLHANGVNNTANGHPLLTSV